LGVGDKQFSKGATKSSPGAGSFGDPVERFVTWGLSKPNKFYVQLAHFSHHLSCHHPTALTLLTNVCAGGANMLFDKYASTGILPKFAPFVVKYVDLYVLYPYNYSTYSTTFFSSIATSTHKLMYVPEAPPCLFPSDGLL